VALDQAKADVAATRAAIASKQAQLEVQRTAIDAAKATIDVDQATVTFAAQENKRYTISRRPVMAACRTLNRRSRATPVSGRDRARYGQPRSAVKQVDLLKAEIVQANATLARAEAAQSQAELISTTPPSSPIDGVVGNRTLRTGQFVQPARN